MRSFAAYVLLGVLLGVADGGPSLPAPTPVVEHLAALPSDTQETRITFQRSDISTSSAYYWIMVWENGINRTFELGPDANYVGFPRHASDSSDFANWSQGSGQCVPSYLWSGLNGNNSVAPYCYVNLNATPLPNGSWNFGLYPFGTEIMRAHPGDGSQTSKTWTVWPNDHYSKVDLFRQPLKNVETGPAVRLDSVSVAQGYLCLIKSGGSTTGTDIMEIVKLTGKTRTVLTTLNIPSPWNGRTLVPVTCTANGSTIFMNVLGYTLGVTDTSYRWGAPGLAQFRPVGSNAAYFDNWSGDGLNNTQTISIRVPPANPGQVRDYDVGIRAFEARMGVVTRSPMSHIVWQRYNPPQSLPDTIKGAVARVHVSANVPLFVDSLYVYYRYQRDTSSAYANPLTLLGKYATRDTTINLPPMVRGWRYTLFTSIKPTITGTIMGATRDTNLFAKLQIHWTSP